MVIGGYFGEVTLVKSNNTEIDCSTLTCNGVETIAVTCMQRPW